MRKSFNMNERNPNTKYPKIPARPSIQEESEAASFNAGKSTTLQPKASTPDSGDTSIIAGVAQAVMTK